MDDLKLQLQLRSSCSGDSGVGSKKDVETREEDGEEDGLQYGLSAAAAALQAADSHAVKHQLLLDQQLLQHNLPQLQLQLQLYAADAEAPALSLLQECDIMSAAQQGR